MHRWIRPRNDDMSHPHQLVVDHYRSSEVNQTCEPKAIGSLHIEVTCQSNEKSMLYNDRDKLHTLICTHKIAIA